MKAAFATFVSCLVLAVGTTPSAFAGGPSDDAKPLFDRINQVRTDPPSNAAFLDEGAAKADPNYKTNPDFTQADHNGGTRMQNMAAFVDYAKSAPALAALEWDDDLAAVAQNGGNSKNKMLKPEFKEESGGANPASDQIAFWWIANGTLNYTIKPLRGPRMKYIGIALKDPNVKDTYVIVASSLPGKAFAMSDDDLAQKPFDARLDDTPPRDTGTNRAQGPTLIQFVRADGGLDVCWREVGPQHRVFISRFSSSGEKVFTKEAPGVDANVYTLLAGFTEDPQGNMYVMRAQNEGYLDKKEEPSTPGHKEGKDDPNFDRPDMMHMTKLDKDGGEVWTKPVARKLGSAKAIFDPLSANEDGTFASTSRIAFATIKRAVYKLADDESVIVPTNIAEACLLGYSYGVTGEKSASTFEDKFQPSEADGVISPKVQFLFRDDFKDGKMQAPTGDAGQPFKFFDGGGLQVSNDIAFDPAAYGKFVEFLDKVKLVGGENKYIKPESLKLKYTIEDMPLIFVLYASATDYDYRISSRHQQAYWRALNAGDGEPIANYNAWAMGHCFDMNLLPSDEGVISIERSDEGLIMANYLFAAQRNHRPMVFSHRWYENDCYSELGNMAPAQDGYMLAFTSNRSPEPVTNISGNQGARNEERVRHRDLAVLKIKKGFVNDLDKVGGFPFEYKAAPREGKPIAVPKSIYGFEAKYLTDYTPEGKFSVSRPRIVAMGDGSLVVFWERWTHDVVKKNDGPAADGRYDSTWAMKIDESGNQTQEPVQLTGVVRITRGEIAFLWNGKAAWLTGNVVDGQIIANTLDGSLKYNAVAMPAN